MARAGTFRRPGCVIASLLAVQVLSVSPLHSENIFRFECPEITARQCARTHAERSIRRINEGEMEAALADAEAAIAFDPASEPALAARAYVRAVHLGDTRGAFRDLRRLLSLWPSDSNPFEGLGYSRLDLGEIGRAVDFFGRIYGIVPNIVAASG